MDNFRLILIVALVLILVMLYQAWQQDYGSLPPNLASTPITETPETPTPPSKDSELPKSQNQQSSALELPQDQAKRLLSSTSRILVETDTLHLEIDTQGGDLRLLDLRDYPVKVETPDELFRLMNDQLPNLFVAQSGLLSQQNAPTHQVLYQSEQLNYRLSDGADTLEVKLHWHDDSGLKVSKIYTFQRGSYVIDLKYVLDNNTTEAWQGGLYGQFQRTEVDLGNSRFLYTYMGGAVSSPEQRYEKIPFNDMQDNELGLRSGWANGWVAMLQHYFVAAWIPEREKTYKYSTAVFSNNRYALRLVGPSQTVEPNSQHVFGITLYAGPKLQDKLAALSPGLDLTVDYGWLWFIAQPLFWMLKFIHQWIGNWGWAIIILTMMIKLAFFHLSATSYKSMANMRRLQPRLVSLKERYGDDKARMNQAMMDLYKKEKINPLGGCLPIVVQIPVFIALYWVLLESVELRQASFIFWLNDLSIPDPYFVLPLIMGATMLVQHYLNPAPIDPVQQKVMLVLPLVFTVFFAFFPSGLVLYWVVNNFLSITQQWVITKKIAGKV
ncbi:MAG: membrane protein insertase YidC [Candidatus Parabeggiatoa sp.]|nr:membrane protein insertase YidC [Candidatus Parabeggiatoa sp.]